MNVFVCASAQFNDYAAIGAELATLPPDATIVQIKPGSGDNAAFALASRRGFDCEEEIPEPLDGALYGPRVWRVLMLRVLDTRPDLLLAFRLNKAASITEIIEEAAGRGIVTRVIDRRARRGDTRA